MTKLILPCKQCHLIKPLRDERCLECRVANATLADVNDYARVWKRYEGYSKAPRVINTDATREQLRRIVGRIARAVHAEIPGDPQKGAEIVNALCAHARGEVKPKRVRAPRKVKIKVGG
jgi:hypothetical protein